jgi:acetyltransferase (GNAT) family protein
MSQEFLVTVADSYHIGYAPQICKEMEESAKARGTGIAKRSPDYLELKMDEGKAVIAFAKDGTWAGFCYIECWGHGEYVANSGLIVAPQFRKSGLAKQIKQKICQLSRTKYPNAKIFGLTTGLAVMKINSDLGYEPVTYSELTQDEAFWQGCKSCVNHDILMSKGRKNCLCTAMLYDPADHYTPEETAKEFKKKEKVYERFLRSKQMQFLKHFKRNNFLMAVYGFFINLFLHNQ